MVTRRKTSVVLFGTNSRAEQRAIYDHVFSIIFGRNIVVLCLVSEKR